MQAGSGGGRGFAPAQGELVASGARLGLLVVSLAACGPSTGNAVAGGSQTGTSMTATTSTSLGKTTVGSGGASTTTDTNTTSGGTGTPAPTGTGVPGTSGGYPECARGNWQFAASAGVDLGAWPASSMTNGDAVWDIDTQCTVADIYSSDVKNVSLACADADAGSRMVVLSIEAFFFDYTLPFDVGQVVSLRLYRTQASNGAGNDWTVFRAENGQLLLGSVYALGVGTDIAFPGVPDAYSPFSLGIVSGLCPLLEGFPCGSPEDPCEFLAVDVSTARAQIRAFQGDEVFMVAGAPYVLGVDTAKRLTMPESVQVGVLLVAN